MEAEENDELAWEAGEGGDEFDTFRAFLRNRETFRDQEPFFRAWAQPFIYAIQYHVPRSHT